MGIGRILARAAGLSMMEEEEEEEEGIMVRRREGERGRGRKADSEGVVGRLITAWQFAFRGGGKGGMGIFNNKPPRYI